MRIPVVNKGGRNSIPLFLALSIIFGCETKNDRSYSDYFEHSHSGNSRLTILDLEIDSIQIQHDIKFSYVGFSGLYQDSIYLIDKLFCSVLVFDKNGKLAYKKLGQGRGPNEMDVKNIDSYAFLKDGRKIFMGSSLDIYLYDKNWNKIPGGRIDWTGNYNYTTIRNIQNPEPDELALYGFEFEKFKVIGSPLHPDVIYAPIYSEHQNFNGFVSGKYYEEGRILASIDFNKLKVIDLLGRRSPNYLNQKFLGHHSFFTYDIAPNGDFYICHEIDSFIYQYDKDFKLIKKFGYAGKNMDTDYTTVSSLDMDRIRYLYFEERPTKGYYDELFFSAETDLLFRSYKKGKGRSSDGLQIYSNDDLIGDVEVPKGFKIMGYISPYYYSSAVIDEINEKIIIYRFKLEN